MWMPNVDACCCNKHMFEANAWEDVSTEDGCHCNEGLKTWGGQLGSLGACKDQCLESSCKQLDWYEPTKWCNTYASQCNVDQSCNGWSAWRRNDQVAFVLAFGFPRRGRLVIPVALAGGNWFPQTLED